MWRDDVLWQGEWLDRAISASMAATESEGPGVEVAMASRRGHGEGSIYRRADGRWVGAVDLGWRDGKRIRRHYSGTTRKEVADVVAVAQQARRVGMLPPRKPPTVAQFLDMWLDALAVEEPVAGTSRSCEFISSRCSVG